MKLNENNVVVFPASKPASPKKKGSPTPMERAAKALANAKQRCKNPVNKDYPNYGGAGIKVLLKNTAALIEAIGLPPPNTSLDRINPHGHYEAGNVRWATKDLQAQNKKNSPLSGGSSTAALIQKYKAVGALPGERVMTSKSWLMGVSMFNAGGLTEQQAAFLGQAGLADGALHATFELNQEPDWGFGPGVFHLPALSLPDARVSLRGGAFRRSPLDDTYTQAGLIYDLGYVHTSFNMPPAVARSLKKLKNSPAPGLTWLGQPSVYGIEQGWFESWSLALACRLRCHGVSAAALPVLSVLSALEAIGSRTQWDYDRHPVLDAAYLFMPDFQVDCGSWGSLSGINVATLDGLLTYRAERGLKSVVGVQNAWKLSEKMKARLLGLYHAVEVACSEPTGPDDEALPPIKEDRPMVPSQLNFRMLRENLATRRLVT